METRCEEFDVRNDQAETDGDRENDEKEAEKGGEDRDRWEVALQLTAKIRSPLTNCSQLAIHFIDFSFPL